MDRAKSDNANLMIDAGHPRAAFAPPIDPEDRLTWEKWLKGALATIAVGVATISLWAASGTVRPLETTVRMERLAAKVERTKSIDSNTAHDIARLIDRHWYDCHKAGCSAQLRARNHAILAHLKALIATKAPLEGFTDARNQDITATETTVVNTGVGDGHPSEVR